MTSASPAPTRSAEARALDALATLCQRLLAAEDELDALDRAIGDGDHGHNLSRAARRLDEVRDTLANLALPDLLRRAGSEIVMSVGGASGPLYGTLLMETGKALPVAPSLAEWATAFAAGVAGLAKRGRAAEGDKTMLDVLAPASRALAVHAGGGRAAALAAMQAAGRQGLEDARPLRARRGRAAYVGERAAGADDPGAASALLCLSTITELLGGES
ncbi:MAG: dihydroxyacetone kinase subunit L [Novosphingobium sp.]|nr:dihydroxyacetone kinase subunit L [Novosphingobium sp.]